MTPTFKKQVFIGAAFIFALALNHAIYAKEQIIETGETVLMELAPVDPRSLMQGDYMRLAYRIERDENLRAHMTDDTPRRGYLVIRPDADKVARFVRIHDGATPLGEGEKLVRYHKPRHNTQVRIVPRSFMFQEGHRAYYEAAEYGIFRFSDSGHSVLTGLADKNRVEIKPPDTHTH